MDENDALNAVQATYEKFRRLFAGERAALPSARRALARVPDRPLETAELAQQLNSLGADLRRYADFDGDPEVLDAAIEAYEKSLRVCPLGWEHRRLLLSSLSQGLTDRFEQRHEPDDADRAVRSAADAVRELPSGTRWAPQLYLCLLRALVARARPEDVGAAIQAERSLREHVAAIGDASEAGSLDEAAAEPRWLLGRALLEGAQGGDALLSDALEADGGDLDRAIDLMRSAADAAPQFASDLVHALTRRYLRSGRLDDVDEAVRIGEAALAKLERARSTPPTVVAALHRNVGIARRATYVVDPEPDRLPGIVRAFEAALAASPRASTERLYDLVNLANILADRHAQQHDRADLDRAIELYEEALGQTQPSGEGHEILLLNLAETLVDRYKLDHAPGDIQRAIATLERGLTVFSEGPTRPEILSNLGGALATLYAQTHRPEDLSRAITAFREAATTAMRAAPTAAVRTARAWGRWASERESWAEAAEAYRLGIDAMSRLVDAQSTRSSEESWLAATQGIPAAAGYALIRTGDLEGAASLLEQGRAVLLSRALESSDDAARQLASDDVTSQRAGETIAYIAAAPRGGYSLALESSGRSALRHIPLPALDEASFGQVVVSYIEAYERRHDDRSTWMMVLDRTCSWLWTVAIGPLLEATQQGRLVVIPVGWLGFLPLHAAWREDHDAPTGRHYAVDEATWAYAPSIRSLRAARRRSRAESGAALVVDDPQPVNAPVLRFAAREAEFALRGSSERIRLRKHRARYEQVRSALAGADRMHFACHALADLLEPLKSGLVLTGNARLTLRDIQGLNLRARLAVLSACETAMTGLKLVDEVVGLPTGLLQAGVRGVVGSTWSVNDLSTLLVMARFYEGLLDEGLDAPDALRQAQRWVRDASNADKAARYPDVAELRPGEHLSPAARAFWQKARTHAHPYHWAGFQYAGA